MDSIPDSAAPFSTDSATSIEPFSAIVPITATNPRQSRGLIAVTEIAAGCLPWLWIIGTPLTFVLLATGIVGAERLRRGSRALTGGPIAECAARIARSLAIGRRVTVAVCERVATPVLVGILRPMILLPPAALTGWSPEEIEMVLLHELAHVRRWDNLVNLAQRIVEAALFFQPAVWLVSGWVRREREACCDAVVVGETKRPQAYAELLVALAAQLPRSVLFHPAATSAMAAGPIRKRIRRVMGIDDDPMLISGKSLAVVMSGLLLAATLVVLNLPGRSEAEQKAEFTTEGTEEKVEVQFVVGASRFADGDRIEISKVRGTKSTFEPGGTYWIEGTYTLKSRDSAKLVASVTAKNAADRTGAKKPALTQDIRRGSGTFSLAVHMTGAGWPHVSFYPADGGQSFGGVYFGTGDSVLEKWWGDTANATDSEKNSLAPRDVVDTDTDALSELLSDKDRVRSLFVPGPDNSVLTYGWDIKPDSLPLFDALVELLEEEPRNSKIRFSYKISDGGSRLQTIAPKAAQQSVIKPIVQMALKTGKPLLQTRRFPTLEEQKLADAIWKQAGLELEPVGAEGLKHAQAQGYTGGVKVSDIAGHPGGILPGDILVGLHVWPTTSFEDVADILNRDDLAELNPLKYYVVRLKEIAVGGFGFKKSHEYTVVTGRISVRVSASKETEKEAQSKYANSPQRVEATPMPIPRALTKSTANDALTNELANEVLASDPTWQQMLQEFMSLQYQLEQVQASTNNVPSREGDRLRLLIAAKLQEINQYRRRLSDLLGGERESSGLPVPKIPNAVVPRTGMPMIPNAVVPRTDMPTIPNAVAPRTSSPLPEVPQASKQSAPSASSTFLDIPPLPPLTDDEKAVLRKGGPIRIDLFYTSDSEACRQALDMIPKYEEAFGDLITVSPINVETDRAAAKREGINHLPTYKLYQGDLGIQTSVGVQRIVDLEQALARVARRDTPAYIGPPKTELRYNGSTFDQWRTELLTELSAERRLIDP